MAYMTKQNALQAPVKYNNYKKFFYIVHPVTGRINKVAKLICDGKNEHHFIPNAAFFQHWTLLEQDIIEFVTWIVKENNPDLKKVS